jgi:hypothetical protein
VVTDLAVAVPMFFRWAGCVSVDLEVSCDVGCSPLLLFGSGVARCG